MDVEAIFDRWEAAWTGRDPRAFTEVCAPDLHYEDPLTQLALRSPEELGEHAQTLWNAFPDARMERAGSRLVDDHFAVAPCRLVGTHDGALEALPASGRVISVHMLFYCELDRREPRLWRVRAFFDAYAVGCELGVLPRRGSVAGKALLVMRGYGLRVPLPWPWR
jgi:steroid delta-isomerase-like uncharacterized protein